MNVRLQAVEDSCVGVWWWRLWRDGHGVCRGLQLIDKSYILNRGWLLSAADVAELAVGGWHCCGQCLTYSLELTNGAWIQFWLLLVGRNQILIAEWS